MEDALRKEVERTCIVLTADPTNQDKWSAHEMAVTRVNDFVLGGSIPSDLVRVVASGA